MPLDGSLPNIQPLSHSTQDRAKWSFCTTDTAHGVPSAQVTKAVRSPAMPRRQKAPTPAHSNEALTLLTLQQQVLQFTAARATLDEVLELVHETPLCNLASAQDRRTLNTAQSCLESLRIGLEAHANTVEDTVRQKQVSLVLRQRQEAAVATELPTDVSACVFVLFGRLLVLFLSWNGIINTCTTNQVAFHSIGSTCNN